MKVSVIMPVYNAEKYLEKALDSVINQTLKDIEIILVNDGSTDGSKTIIDRYAAIDDRIVVINKPNGGVAQARADGVAISKGDYIQTMDNDDYMYPDALEKLYTKAIATNADMVVGLTEFYVEHTGETIEDNRVSFDEITGIDLFSLICHDKARWATWTRLHKATIYRDQEILISPLVNRAEDVYLTAQLCYYAKKVVSIDDIIITWYIRLSSLSNRPKMSERENAEFINIPIILREYFDSKGLEKQLETEMMIMSVHFEEERILRGHIRNAYKRCREMQRTLQLYPDIESLLTFRMLKIIKTFDKYSYFAYLRLWKYKIKLILRR